MSVGSITVYNVEHVAEQTCAITPGNGHEENCDAPCTIMKKKNLILIGRHHANSVDKINYANGCEWSMHKSHFLL